MSSQFITCFDRNYLYKGLALYRSLERHAGDFTLRIVCFDAETREILSQLKLARAKLVTESELDAFDPQLAAARADGRTRVEYFWTSTPVLPRLVFAQEPSAEVATYLDADLFFYSSTAPMLDELDGRSVLIHEHRFHVADAPMLEHGRFNVGALMFRRDPTGEAALALWREQCLAWCHARVENGKFGDQLYLDDWPRLYGERLAIAAHPGIGLGPWNLRSARVVPGDPPTVEGKPVVFFHFHGLQMLSRRMFEHVRSFPVTPLQRAAIYVPYVRALRDAMREIGEVAPHFSEGFAPTGFRPLVSAVRRRRLLVSAAGRIWHR